MGTPGRGKVGGWESTFPSLPSPTLLLVPFSFSHVPPPQPLFTRLFTAIQPPPPQDHSHFLGSPMHVLGRHSVSEVAGGSPATLE